MNRSPELSQSGDTPRSDVPQLADQLAELEGLLTTAGKQVSEYLRRLESRSAVGGASGDAIAAQIAELGAKIDGLEHQLASRPANLSAAGTPPEEILAAVCRQEEVIREQVARMERQLASGFERLVRLLASPEQPKEEPTITHGSQAWQQAILGPDLAGIPSLAFKRNELLEGVLAGDPGARALAGQLLVFQSAPAERLPQMLKDIGEAYYRWAPKKTPGPNPFEQALVNWLQKTCETSGIPNIIELVHPGERFDATRHNATSRGVEITEVLGWIILRPGGKIYTKASVGVR